MRRRSLSFSAAVVAVLVGSGEAAVAPPASAATVAAACSTTFTGAVSVDWFDPSNWDHGAPGSGAQACVPQGKTARVGGFGGGIRATSVAGLNADGSAPGNLVIGDLGQFTLTGPGSVAALTVGGQNGNSQLNVANGATLAVSGLTSVTQGPQLTVDGTLSAGGGLTLAATSGNTLGGAGAVNVTGPFRWDGGNVFGSVHVVQAAGSTAVIDDTAFGISDTAVVTLNSPTSVTPPPGSATGTTNLGAGGGALEFGAATTLADGVTLYDNAISGSHVRVLGGGSLSKPTGNGTATVQVAVQMLPGSSASVSSGTLALAAPTGPGSISVAANAKLSLTRADGSAGFSGTLGGQGTVIDDGASLAFTSASSVNGPALVSHIGTLSFAGPVTTPSLDFPGLDGINQTGSMRFAGALTVDGPIRFPSGGLEIDGSATAKSLDLPVVPNRSPAQLSGPGTLTVNGPFHWGWGGLNGIHVVDAAGSTATIDTDGSQSSGIGQGATLSLLGAANVNDAPSSTAGGTFVTGGGSIEFGGATSIADGVVFNDNATGPSAVRFLPGSSLTQSPNANPALFAVPVEVRGDLTVPPTRKLVAQRPITVPAGSLRVTGTVQDSQPTVVSGGSLLGAGTLSGAVQLTSGSVQPGGPTGALTVGQYTQSGGTLAVSATGTGAGQVTSVAVTGSQVPTLSGGSIAVTRSGYVAQPGDVLHVLTAPSSVTPSVSSSVTVTDAGLPSSESWSARAVAGGVDLVLTGTAPAPAPAPTPTPSPTSTPTPTPVPTTVCTPTARVSLTRAPALTSVRRGAVTTLTVRVSLRGTACASGFKVTLFSAPLNPKGKPGRFRKLAVITVRDAGVASFRILAVKRTSSFLWYAAVGRVRSAVGKVVVR